jgi:nicotinamidase-related amidase
MLIDAQRSTLLAIDLQQKMLPAIADGEQILANCTWLIRVAQKIGVPVAACEQYPKGLGPLALDLYHEGKEVYVVADCVGSRRHSDRDLALARMRQEGVRIVWSCSSGWARRGRRCSAP